MKQLDGLTLQIRQPLKGSRHLLQLLFALGWLER